MPLPKQDPDPDLVRQAEAQLEESWPLYEERLERMEARQHRFTLWALASEVMAAEYRLPERIPGLATLMFGEDPESGSLIVLAAVSPAALGLDRARAEDITLTVFDDRNQGVEVPVYPVPFLVTPHRVDLLYATLTCWVRPLPGGSGILTARHASGSGVVHLDDGNVRPVLWYAPECLDALVAEGAPVQALEELAVSIAAQGDAVEAITKRGPEPRVVSEIGQAFGTTTAAIPHYFLTDTPLRPGDSGSLLRLRAGGPGVGLYIGELTTPLGARGLCQSLHQLDRLFQKHGYSTGFYEEEGVAP